MIEILIKKSEVSLLGLVALHFLNTLQWIFAPRFVFAFFPICFHLYKVQEQMRLVSAMTGQEEAERASGMLGDVLFLNLRLVTWVPVCEKCIQLYICDTCTFLEVSHFNKKFFKICKGLISTKVYLFFYIFILASG